MKAPSKLELIVDNFLESDTAMYIGGALVALFIIWVYLSTM